MAKSIKSLLTDALSQHLNLDAVKREYYRDKYQKEALQTRFPITSRHKNTLVEVRNAFIIAGAEEQLIRWVETRRYGKDAKDLEIALPNLLIRVSEARGEIRLHHPYYGYGMDITHKSLEAVAKYFVHVASLWSQWNEEWDELVNSCAKRAKLRSMNETSIDVVLKEKLAGSGLKYKVKRQQYRVTLTLVMKHNVQATFIIQHSKFRQQLEKILPAVQQLNELMDDLGQPIKIKTLERNAKWEETESASL